MNNRTLNGVGKNIRMYIILYFVMQSSHISRSDPYYDWRHKFSKYVFVDLSARVKHFNEEISFLISTVF